MESLMGMEAENSMNPRRSFSTMGSNYLGGGGGGGGFRQLFSDDGGMSRSYGGYYPPPDLYSSRSLVPHQPPLLPLPFSAAYGKKTVVVATVRSKNSMKKKKARKPAAGCIRQSKEEVHEVKKAEAEEEEETGEEFLLSPSPSSLPLPRLLLTARPKAEAVTVTDDLHRLLCL